MYFKATYRHKTNTNKSDWYYRLVESYRNALDEVRQRTLLIVGFLSENSICRGSLTTHNKRKESVPEDIGLHE